LKVEDPRMQLGIGDDDLESIRNSRDTNSILLVLVGALISIAAFVAGYAVGKDSGDSYPYASVSAVSLAGARKARVSWVGMLILAIVAFLSFGFGNLTADPPNFGITTYYGVYGTKT